MEEIFEMSDRVSVLKDGRYVATLQTAQTDQQELVSLMVGRKLQDYYLIARQ